MPAGKGRGLFGRKKGPAADLRWGQSKGGVGPPGSLPPGAPGKGSDLGCGPRPCRVSHLLPQKRLASPSRPEPPPSLGNLG